MIAIIIHEVVTIPSELIADLFDYPSNVFFRKIGTSDLYTLPVHKIALAEKS